MLIRGALPSSLGYHSDPFPLMAVPALGPWDELVENHTLYSLLFCWCDRTHFRKKGFSLSQFEVENHGGEVTKSLRQPVAFCPRVWRGMNALPSSLSPLNKPGAQSREGRHPQRAGLPATMNLIKIISCRHAQRPISQRVLNLFIHNCDEPNITSSGPRPSSLHGVV